MFVTAYSDDNNKNEPITPFHLDMTYYENGYFYCNESDDISLATEDENQLEVNHARYDSDLGEIMI